MMGRRERGRERREGGENAAEVDGREKEEREWGRGRMLQKEREEGKKGGWKWEIGRRYREREKVGKDERDI